MDQHRLTQIMEAARLTKQGRLAEAASLLSPGRGGGLGQGRLAAPPTGSRSVLDALSKARVLTKHLPLHRGADRPVLAAPGQFLDFTYGRGNDERSYKLYVPTGYTGQLVPMIVMLHGGTQNAHDFAVGTGMSDLAEQHTFLVAYPEQSRTANPMGYWNWFRPADQRRGSGEPAIIAGITAQVADTFAVDTSRVGLAGFSAGGAMAAVVAAAYPDVFTVVGVHSGLAAGAAYDVPSAFTAMREGAKRPIGTSVPLIVFHGDADSTVNHVNAESLVRADAPTGGRSPVTETQQVPSGRRYTRTVHPDDGGIPVVEHWTVHGSGHAWSGGRSEGTYTDPEGPDASAELVRFLFEQAHSRTPAKQAPNNR